MHSVSVPIGVDSFCHFDRPIVKIACAIDYLTASTMENFNDAHVQFLRVTPQAVDGYYIYQTVYR